MALLNKVAFAKPPPRSFSVVDPIKPAFQNVASLLKSSSAKETTNSTNSAAAALYPAGSPSLPPIPISQNLKSDHHETVNNEVEEKISSDHISVAFYSPVEEGPAIEFFLRNTKFGYTFFETPTPAPLDPWRVPLDKYLKTLHVPTSLVQGLLRLDRWAVPGMDRMVSHAVCSVKITKDQREQLLDRLDGGVWIKLSDVIDLHQEKKLLSSDVMDTLQRFQLQQSPLTMGIELSFTESFLGVDLSKSRKSGLELLIQAAKLGRNEQEILYTEFLKLSVPFLTMGLKGFTTFMKALGWGDEDCKHLFRTFDMQNKEGLSYRDFLCGIAATEPIIQHGGPPAEIRCRYIFKFYDRDGDGRLSFNEFKTLVKDVRRSRNVPDDPNTLHTEAEKQAKLFGENSTDSLGLTEFLTCVGQLRFRGTSHLLRASTSILKILNLKETVTGIKSKRLETKRSRTSADFISLNALEEEAALGGFKQSEMSETDTYEIASHSVRVRKSGTVLDVHSIWDIEHSGIFGKKPSLTKSTAFGSSAVRLRSVFNFNQNGQAKEMLNGLKYFENKTQVSKDQTKSNLNISKPAFSWGEVDRIALGSCLITICGLVKDILINEPRLIELNSPVYILGDIHGNFPDLLCFEKALWRLGPLLTPATFLFLGDYVDRGEFGVEVVSYLFCHKLTAPSKFNLLRGNHEIREVQQMFTFYKECLAKFGEKLGREVWNAVNEVFDVMPLAAVIDNKIFCAHGGIPPPWMGNGLVSIVKSIPTPLQKPEEQSKLAWELMWSDPMYTENMSAEQKAQLELKEGFGTNLRRGTAHVYTEQALETFLKTNGFSHVVRAHEVQQAGFHVQFGGKLLTVFSSSKYCGGSNEAACILADKLKLRTIRLDTS